MDCRWNIGVTKVHQLYQNNFQERPFSFSRFCAYKICIVAVVVTYIAFFFFFLALHELFQSFRHSNKLLRTHGESLNNVVTSTEPTYSTRILDLLSDTETLQSDLLLH